MLAEDAVENRINMFEMIIEIELFFYLLSGQGGRDVGICLQQFHQRQCAIGFPDLHGIEPEQATTILAAATGLRERDPHDTRRDPATPWIHLSLHSGGIEAQTRNEHTHTSDP